VFADNIEKMILEEKQISGSKEKFIDLRTLHMLQDKYVKFIQDDPVKGNESQFYFVCCKDYGNSI
jgi:hypothetical protein